LNTSRKLREIFPGAIFFGSNLDMCLEIPVNKKIRGIRFSIASEEPEFLNFTKFLLLTSDGKPFTLSKGNSSVKMSSVFNGNNARFGSDYIQGGDGGEVHTEKESSPYVKILLNQVQDISKIKVLNRADKWSKRNKNIRIEILTEDAWEFTWQNSSDDIYGKIHNSLSKWLTKSQLQKIFDLSPAQARHSIKTLLAEILNSSLLDKFLKEDTCLFSILDFYGESPADQLDIEILAALIANSLKREKVLGNFSFIQNLITTKALSLELQQQNKHVHPSYLQ
jgi:hypothetical protein